MKRLILLGISTLLFTSIFAQNSNRYSVTIEAQITEAEEIVLTFNPFSDATSYDVFRKQLYDQSWGDAIANLNGNDSVFVDKDIIPDVVYDYYIRKNGGITAHGYISAGANMSATHNRGITILLVDSALATAILHELSMLRHDLVGDGNQVIELTVSQDLTPVEVKSKIDEIVNSNSQVNHLYILGHVPVPYSGIYCEDSYWVVPPDGHREGAGNHCGAWAADAYYGILNATWTDTKTCVDGTRSFTRNEPGDGKFDQIVLPGEVSIGVGRVDLSNMPKFSKSEVELTKQYINKAHSYRYGINKPTMKAVIDENFGANANEQFGGGGWRFFGNAVGRENIEIGDYMSTLKDDQYIWAHGTGPGSFTSCGGVGTTDNFVTNQGAAYFNMLFGSFFGNWNVANNFLRAPLAVENGGLTNAWSGRPNWIWNPIALNATAGFCAIRTQNNKDTYAPGYFANQIHVALMGDPTLRMHMFEPPTSVVATPSADKKNVTISWTASTAKVDGYYVYSSRDSMGPFKLLNIKAVSGNELTVESPHHGMVYFMVRATRNETTHAGTFENLSQGSFGKSEDLINLSIDPSLVKIKDVKVYPNPTSGFVNIAFESLDNDPALVALLNAQGQVIRSGIIDPMENTVHQYDVSNLSPGLYFIRVGAYTKKFVIK